MIAILAAFCAYLLGMQRWVPDYNRLVTETAVQAKYSGEWHQLYVPVTHDYVPGSLGAEVFWFVVALGATYWAWCYRKDKVNRAGVLATLVIAVPFVIYIPMMWLARHHVEGDWTAVPPMLRSSDVLDAPWLNAKAREETRDLSYRQYYASMAKRHGFGPEFGQG
jgi:hypothetical protein